MPNSSEARNGRYISTKTPKQNSSSDVNSSVNVNVNELPKVPSQSNASKLPRVLLIGSVVILAILAICAGVATPVIISQLQTAATSIATSSTSSSTNTASSTTVGSSSSNSATSSTSSASTGASTTAGTVSSASSSSTGASTTASTASSASTTTVAAGFSAGGAVLSGTTAWYGYEQVTVNCTANLNNITITISVQKTVNASYSGAFSTFWGGTVSQSYVDNGAQVIYTWIIVNGQTIQASGSPYVAQAQFTLYGVNQVTSADTFTVRATTVGGVTSSFSGHF